MLGYKIKQITQRNQNVNRINLFPITQFEIRIDDYNNGIYIAINDKKENFVQRTISYYLRPIDLFQPKN